LKAVAGFKGCTVQQPERRTRAGSGRLCGSTLSLARPTLTKELTTVKVSAFGDKALVYSPFLLQFRNIRETTSGAIREFFQQRTA